MLRTFATTVCASLLLAPAGARAQQTDPPGTLSPSGGRYGRPAPEPAPEPAPAPGPYGQPAPAGQPGEGGEGAEAALDDVGYYLYDDNLRPVENEDEGLVHGGPVPELHVVRTGDTLWDICGFYFNNPWEWPKVWSYNPTITNPHWIYPGDLVRLGEGSGAPAPPDVDAGEPTPEPIMARAPTGAPSSTVRLRQLAFIERDKLDAASTIVGSEEEKEMLSQNDVVYLTYPAGEPPQVGRRYAIYSATESVKDAKGKQTIGSYVWVLGELEVLSVKKDKRARAVIREANDVIERGARVGPLQRTYRSVEPVANAKDQQGTIVAQLTASELIGAQQLVFMDLGERHGLEAGNRLFVVRKGDAKPAEYERRAEATDDRFPAYAIGEVMVVQVGAAVSVGLVTLSVQEFGVGDLVLMRQGK